MYAKNVEISDLVRVAEMFNFEVEAEYQGERNRIKFKLRNKSDKYWVITRGLSCNDRVYRTKVCYHGHYVFLEKLFQEYPDAIVEASWYKHVKYTKDTFRDLAEEVGDLEIRQYDHLMVREKCGCERVVYLTVDDFLGSFPEVKK